MYTDSDEFRNNVTKKVDWDEDRHGWANWRRLIGPQTRGIWHTLTDEQKIAIATDSRFRAEIEDEAASRHG